MCRVITGDEDGSILTYCAKTYQRVGCVPDEDKECINAIVCHPYRAAVLYATGSRHFGCDDEDVAPPASRLKCRHLEVSHSTLQE